MNLFNYAAAEIDKGEKGLNIGLPHNLNRLKKYLPNIQQSTYYLIGAESGVGKTAFVDDIFIFNPFEHYINNKNYYIDKGIDIEYHYFSLEISKTPKIGKLICRKLFEIDKTIVDTNYIYSRGDYKIDNETKQKIYSLEPYFQEFSKKVFIYDDVSVSNPTGIHKKVYEIALRHGNVVKEGYNRIYIKKNPNLYLFIIIDHIGLIKTEEGLSPKGKIDRLSSYAIEWRNLFGFSPIIISQFNRSLASAERAASVKDSDKSLIRPQLSDFKETGDTQQDANVVGSLFSPYRYDIKSYDNGYNINLLKDRFRSFTLLKTRDGTPDISVPLFYIGEIGRFSELNTIDEIKKDPAYYTKILTFLDEKTKWKIF